ncbi:MAG: ATP-binding protein [Veillonella caviae]|uniref:ATP-binding protein n=1 Tax=Veillonella caviae TaxID=248316 RepID=UPI002A91AD0B|nr:ATP-binding protein [Veillonella caviae]MDY5714755.1 ATP-binding protein [Veillonella caviae]
MANDVSTKTEAVPVPKYANVAAGYQAALQVVDDVILKNYITNLSNLEIVPLSQDILDTNIDDNVLFFKITEMVYEKEEFASYKFASVFNTLSSSDTAIFIIIDSDGETTDFYMGVRSLDSDKTTSSLRNTLENAMIGQFPGIKTQDYDVDEIKEIMAGIKGNSISAVSCVANSREENLKNNQEFVQGLEKLVLSMRGQKYTGIIIANSTDQNQLRELRRGYESVYTQLSPFATMQVNYAQNSSTGKNESTSDSTTKSTTNTITESETDSTTESHGTSKENTTSKVIKGVSAAAGILGAALAPVTGGVSLAVGGVVSGGFGLLGSALASTVTDSTATSNAKTYGESTAVSDGSTHTYTSGTSVTEGLSNAITLTAYDKSVEDMLTRIDKQLKRMDEFESLGMYECAAYFMSEDQYAADIAAATYKAIMRGENSGVEIAAINSWGNFEKDKTKLIEQYVKNFMHPVFKYSGSLGSIEVTPSAMVSGNELAIHMGLPRKSVCGLPVIEHADFGKEVVKYEHETSKTGINLGKVFNMGSACPNDVRIDKASLSMHTFVTGSTGSGKSNTIYEFIRQTNNLGANFMVIEPAKGEYKHVFGNRPDVKVFGTNPEYSDLLRINPFRFPSKIHVLEHVDRLVEIFNVCWPMYAAMPAVLKDALLKSYEDCGWDFSSSKNAYGDDLYPTFMDLQECLVEVINSSAYSEEVKSNYMGSLVTRVKSLTNGLNGQIFASNEIPSEVLFDKNVVVDLSRIGSLETKSLIMGLLIMRLSEYRMSTADSMNVPFKHMTILEEAHNILKRTSSEQNPESPSLAGKSVEMISNAIAEMRTYGEGFVIVDQSPSAVDISAIRNTNTKIIMRLPDESDRRLAGKAAGLRDDQLDEIAKLPKGVAVVYQNDWVDPVLCKIQKYKGEETEYQYKPVIHLNRSTDRLKKNLLELLLRTRVKNPVDVDIDTIKSDLATAEISTKSKLLVKKLVNEYELRKELSFWKDDNFESLSKLVSGVLNGNVWLKPMVDTSAEFDVLTDRIMHEVEAQVSGLSAEYAIASTQCLMRAEAAKSDDYKEIYSAWITSLRNKGVF